MSKADKEEVPQLDFKVLIDQIRQRLECMVLFADDEPEDTPVLQRTYQMAEGAVPVMVVGGINASGKSILSSVIGTVAKTCGYTRRTVSMNNRTASGFERAMIFGDESDSSTGVNSVSAVINGIKSSMTNDTPAVLILDEPDIGLSEEYSGALGEYIAQNVMQPDHNLKLVVVISHSRPLFRRLLKAIPFEPHTVFLGDKNKNFMDWLLQPVGHFGPEEIELLKTRGRETWRAINRAIQD
ncbi:MAG: hypothetical protein RSG77_21785 [Hafnia sp.]